MSESTRLIGVVFSHRSASATKSSPTKSVFTEFQVVPAKCPSARLRHEPAYHPMDPACTSCIRLVSRASLLELALGAFDWLLDPGLLLVVGACRCAVWRCQKFVMAGQCISQSRSSRYPMQRLATSTVCGCRKTLHSTAHIASPVTPGAAQWTTMACWLKKEK